MNNDFSITIGELTPLLKVFHKTNTSVFLLSQPGLGKSESIMQFAKDINSTVHVIVASLHDRLDFTGLPATREDSKLQAITEFTPMRLICELSKERNPNGEPSVLYLNELNAAPETVLPVLYRLIWERRVGDLSLRDNVFIIADGNPSGSRSAGREIHQALRRRFAWIRIRPDFCSWEKWAQKAGIDGRVIAFLHTHPQCFSDFAPEKRERITYACPASWARLSGVLDDLVGISNEVVRCAGIAGMVGDEAGAAFHSWIKYSDRLPNIDGILKDPRNATIPTESDILWILCGCLYNKAQTDKRLREPVITFAARLVKEAAEYGVWLARMISSNPSLTVGLNQTKSFMELSELLCSKPDLRKAIISASTQLKKAA